MSDQESPEPSDTQEAPQAGRGGGGGMLFPAIIILVIAAWCIKDGFITPDATSTPVFNRVGAVVLGLGGLAMLAYELLRPRSDPAAEEKPETPETGDGTP